MTFNDWVYFISGIIWGGWMVRPLVDIVKKIYQNAKEAQNGNNSLNTNGINTIDNMLLKLMKHY